MHYITYCSGCDAITGHEADLKTLTCKKCGQVVRAPVGKWIVGGGLILLGTALAVWIIVCSVSVLISLL